MLLVHSHVGFELLFKAESKLNLDFFLNLDWGYHLILKTVMNMLQLLWETLRKKIFRTSNWNLFCFDLYLVLSCISMETLAHLCRYFCLAFRLLFHSPNLFSGLNNPSSFSCSSWGRYHPLQNLLQLPVSLLYLSQNWLPSPRCDIRTIE